MVTLAKIDFDLGMRDRFEFLYGVGSRVALDDENLVVFESLRKHRIDSFPNVLSIVVTGDDHADQGFFSWPPSVPDGFACLRGANENSSYELASFARWREYPVDASVYRGRKSPRA